jgi:signal transduction histidine kinase
LVKRTHLRKIINILFFILLCNFTRAQVNIDTISTNVSLFKDYTSITDKCLVFIDSSNTTNPDNILQQKQWIPYNFFGLKTLVPPAWVTKTVYLKFTLQNSSQVPDTVYFYPGNSFRSIKVYKILPGAGLQQVKDESKMDGFQPVILLPEENISFVAALLFTKRNFNSLNPQIVQKKYLTIFQKVFYTITYDELVVGYLLSGLLLMMIFFNATNFRLTRKKEFIYNCCYAICMFILIFLNTYTVRRSGLFAGFFMGYLAFALLIIGTVFYIAFTRKFLDTKTNYTLLNKIFNYEEIGLLVLLTGYSFIYFFTDYFRLQAFVENGTKIIVLGIGILYIAIGLKQKNKLINYLAWGNAILIFFAIISFTLILWPVTRKGIFTTPMLYYEIGIVCELIFFLLGLTYKNRIELIEKIKEQEALKLTAEKHIFESRLAILNAQQEERNRISADMHDDLGAGVTAIRLFSELAKSRLGKDTVPEIEKISSSANELLNNMNAIIWTMNSSNDSFGNMVAYIRSYAIEYLENTGIKCRIEITTELPEIAVKGDIRRNVFLVVKEALNNVLKHSKATEVSLTLKKEDNGMSLLIHDNGTGIDFDNLRRFGNGLKNMKQRMVKSGIIFSIENKNGTLVTLHSPKQN